MLTQAETLDGEIVEGWYSWEGYEHGVGYHIIVDKNKWEYTINPKTLRYKVGNYWYSMEELEYMANFYNNYEEQVVT